MQEELRRAVGSEAFVRSPRSRAFLSYIVTETLAGRADRLSERTIGRHVLGRGEAFDGRFDASVRVQATRVRRALDDLNTGAGGGAVQIILPLGTYVPRFERAHVAAHAGDSRVAVVRFASSGPEPSALLAEAVGDAVVRRLSTFPGIRVVGPLDAAPVGAGALSDGTSDPPPLFVLEGRVAVSGDAVRLDASVKDHSSGETVWATTDTRTPDEVAAFGLEDAWSGRIAGEIGDYAGVVFRADSTARASRDDDPVGARAAVLAFHAHIASGDMESLDSAAGALDRAMASGARAPDVLAMRASTLAVRAAYGRSDDPERDLALAEQLARRTLDSDRLVGHAHGVLGTVALVRGRHELVRAHARSAAEASPFHPSSLGTAGTLLAYAGDWSLGLRLLRDAIALSPQRLSHARSLIALDLIIAGNDEAALAEADQIAADDAEWGPLYRAMALAGLGEIALARAEFARATRIEPVLSEDPEAYFTRMATFTEWQLGAVRARLSVLGALESQGRRPGESTGTTT